MCLGRCVVRGLPSVVRGRTLSEPPQSSRSRQARQPSAGPERPVSSRGGRRLPGLAGRSGQDPERMHAGRGGELSEHQARAREAMFRVRPVGRAAAVRPRWNQGHGDPLDRTGRPPRSGRTLGGCPAAAERPEHPYRRPRRRPPRPAVRPDGQQHPPPDHGPGHTRRRPRPHPPRRPAHPPAGAAGQTHAGTRGLPSHRHPDPARGDWLFPGRAAGRPIHESQLLRRLRAHGVRARQGRSTALFTLARQLPAGQLSKMLGIHVGVAVAWQRASGGDWMGYAADVAARSAIRTRSQASDDTDQSAELYLFDESRLSACEAATWWHRNAADMCRRARCRSELQRAKPPAFQRRNPGHRPVPPTPQAIHVDTGDLGERPQLRHELLAVDECLSTAAAVGVIGGRAARRAGHGWGRHG